MSRGFRDWISARGGEDSELICVITTLLHPAALTAAEMAFARHQRWGAT